MNIKKVIKALRKQGVIVILLTFSLFSFAQTQVGSDIDGLSAGDKFGTGVSMSSDGSTVAISGNGNLGSGGLLRVFKNISGIWTLCGTDINGENFGGNGSSKVSLSSDGNTLAFFSSDGLTIFSYDSGTSLWTQKGNNITNNTATGGFGGSYDLSSDGNTIVIGIPGASFPVEPAAGIAQIFHYDAGTWNQVGNNIAGTAPERLGRRVRISSDGNIVAVANTNSVRLYQNIAGVWTQLGTDILAYETSGLSLSSSGETIVIGERDFSDTLIQRGRTRVFNYSSGTWNQIGTDILGEVAYYRSGWSVSLSSDGQVLAIGEIGSTSGSTDMGRTRIFQNQGGSLVQIGNEIFGEASEDYSGSSVSLSADASTIAIGASQNDGNGIDSGHVRIYELSNLLSINEIVKSQIKLFPNPANEQITIHLDERMELKKIDIYNSLGKLVKSISKNVISTLKLSTGIYYVNIHTSQGKTIKKIVIK